jgi:pyruvate kinase
VKRAKIIATIGPASSDPEVVRGLIDAGMNVARLNLSHGEPEAHRAAFATVRAAAEHSGAVVAILADLAGPKIRVGRMAGGHVDLLSGSRLAITTDEVLGTADRISTTYRALARDVRPGDSILIDDGLIRLEVEGLRGREVITRVMVGGTLRDRKGMNLPGTPLSTPALTDKDRSDLELALALGVDYIALSFVRRPEDVHAAKRLAGGVPVIAKIEKPEAIDQREAIADAADGLMVARGDLGVEAGFDKVPLMQKQLIRDAAARGKPVIVATQMLESMIGSPVPTRAEVSDVANAVLDGADALMLSGETAVGAYPVEAVRRMSGIIAEVEASELYRLQPEPVRIDEYSFDNAIARAAAKAASDLRLTAIAVYTESGHSAALLSASRPYAPILGMSRNPESLRRLALRWGVVPVVIDRWITDVQEGLRRVERTLVERGMAGPGDDIAVTFGMLEISGPGRTNVLTLWRIRGDGMDRGQGAAGGAL